MANKNIFCNTPWYELQIYWDGGLGICCQESRRLYSDSERYNIKETSIANWFNSEPVRKFRLDILGNQGTDACSRCYNEEKYSGSSRRHRSNQKSVIFTKTAFDQSYQQSPGYDHFEYSKKNNGHTLTLPIDMHIDLGNYCNLACKMCHSKASSKIATQYVKWGYDDHRQYLGSDWTKDKVVWQRFLNELLDIPKLNNIHFMGGETLLTRQFEEFIDFMILHKKFDLSFSFVTNGTVFNPVLLEKLKKFKRVGIEVSIETTTIHNEYIRQGTDNNLVLANIDQYLKHSTDQLSVTIRPAISALSIGYYDSLIKYSMNKKLLIKSLLVNTPTYLNPNVLPLAVKKKYLEKYYGLLDNFKDIDINNDYNESDPNNYLQSNLNQIKQVISLLEDQENNNQFKELVMNCQKWDREFKFNALELYPELSNEFKKYGY